MVEQVPSYGVATAKGVLWMRNFFLALTVPGMVVGALLENLFGPLIGFLLTFAALVAALILYVRYKVSLR